MRYKTQNWYHFKLFAYALFAAISACSSGSGDGVNNQAPDGSINTPDTDMTINVGDSLDFTATSSDPDGSVPLTYLWSFGTSSGIADATIEDPGLTQFNSEGVFTVSFTVTDSPGLADPIPATRIITVNNTVNNQAPDGSIDTPISDMTINVGDSLDFTATGSDPDGNLPLTYLWSFGAGSGIADANIEDPGPTTFNSEGVFTVSFTVTDSLGLADPAPATRIITINNTVNNNQAPDGSIDTPIGDITINVGDTIDFTATGSDPDGNLPLTYLWSFGAGSGIADATIEDPGLTQFNSEGVFIVRFTVTDSLGLADPAPATRIITVNQAPDGSIDTPVTDMTINVGDTIDFTATGSDPDGNLPLTYLWSFGAGSGIADATIEDPGLVQFNNAGVFTVSFTVTDSLGLADPTPATRIITVNNTVNQAPDGSIDAPGTDLTINVGNTLNFTATGSDPDDDLPLTHLWSFGAGSGIASANVEDPGLVLFNNVGEFTVSYTVTDSLGLADPTPAVRIITVQTASSDPIPKTGWSLLSVDSEELIASNGSAVNAFDGDSNTIWHTQYFPSSTSHPHDIRISLGGAYQLSGLRQLPRQDGSVQGRIKSYAFYVSIDGVNWGSPVASSLFTDSSAEQEILFTPVQAAFVRFVALSEFNGGDLTSMAELTLLGDLTTANLAPNGTIDTPLENLIINIFDTLDFNGTAFDFEGNFPLSYLWNFGAGSGIADANVEDPGPMQFNNEGSFTVSFTVTDSRGLADPTPATRIIDVCTPPSVSIMEPENKHLQSSSTLNVEAHPCLDSSAHAGWGLRFKLKNSGGTTIAQTDVTAAPYQATFTGLLKDEHTVQAIIIDSSSSEVGGTTTQVSQIGIGDYYVAVGDSITLGLGDNISSDNTSLDGRNILGGYTPILNNQLTNFKDYPHTVINKGIAGDTSVEGRSLMPSILTSNPQAQYFLIQYGTNDANIPLPSGLNKSKGQSGYDGSFKDNMKQMITLVENTGKQAYLAKIPYAKGSSSGLDALIQEYNQVVDQLIFENGISVSAPDFYTYFKSNQLEYSDDLHPNGTGYQSMANLWFNALTP